MAQAAYGKTASLHVGRTKFFVSGLLRQFSEFFCQVIHPFKIGVFHYGNHQSLAGIYRDTDMEVLLIDQLVAIGTPGKS